MEHEMHKSCESFNQAIHSVLVVELINVRLAFPILEFIHSMKKPVAEKSTIWLATKGSRTLEGFFQ